MLTKLSLEGVVLDLLIGCGEEDKYKRQPVEIDVWISFPSPPSACISDKVEETVCSFKCFEILSREATKKHFHLLEHLAYAIHTALVKAFSDHLTITVRTRKLKPPFLEITKGISFTYTTTPCSAQLQ